MKEIVFENKEVVFDKGSNEFVHPDGGRQKVYSNLVYYPEKLLWNPTVIDPELKQQALEHCLGLSLGPQPSKRVAPLGRPVVREAAQFLNVQIQM